MTEIKKSSSMPDEIEGFVQTLNRMGFMTSGLDPISRKFVDFSPTAPGAVLDVGAAYGVATIPALAGGASVIANDIDPRHLEILKERVPKEHLSRLKLAPGEFPDKLGLTAETLGGTLICRVLHFFSGEKISRSAQAVFSWLKPGGKVFVVCETAYVQTLKDLIPLYEQRRKRGEQWPGYFDNIHSVNPALSKFLPPVKHLLDSDVLTRVFSEAGFEIEFCETLNRQDFPSWLRLDGRESVGLIGKKKG